MRKTSLLILPFVIVASSALPVGSANATGHVKVKIAKQAEVIHGGIGVSVHLTVRCPADTTAVLRVTVDQGNSHATLGPSGDSINCTGKKLDYVADTLRESGDLFQPGKATVEATLTDAGATDTDRRTVTLS